MTDSIEAVIAKILVELDAEQAEYQKTFKKIYGKEDIEARRIYYLLKNLCDRIRKETIKRS